MAEVSRGRGIFGRLLVAVGLAWVFWGLFGPAIGVQFGNSLVDLPILPGIVILFIGRSLSRGNRRRSPEPQHDAPTGVRVPPRPESRARPAPIPETNMREPRSATETAAVPEVILGAFEVPEPDLPAPDELPIRRTSAEMVAEARERFGRRP